MRIPNHIVEIGADSYTRILTHTKYVVQFSEFTRIKHSCNTCFAWYYHHSNIHL